MTSGTEPHGPLTLGRVLIANRGEIAIRIARAADVLGIDSVAVHPAVDEWSLHTRVATESRLIGAPGEAVAAYLDVDAVVAAGTATGCDCVHPGYGFLAENAAFARACAAAGITFVGPSPDALALFGDKVRARELARSLGIPVVPGTPGAVDGAAAAASRRRRARLPGDARRPRRAAAGAACAAVHDPAEIGEAFERCRSEATAAFGDGAVFIERLVERPRHVEVQILADTARQRRAPPRPRLLGAAAQPEGRGDRPRAGARPGVARAHPRRRGRAGDRVRLRQRRHRRVPRRAGGRRVLLHRVQPADPGRAHRDRAGDRRSTSSPPSSASPPAPRSPSSGSATRTPSAPRAGTPCRPAWWPPAPARSPPTRSRRGRVCASTPAATPGTRRRRSSTRCSPR